MAHPICELFRRGFQIDQVREDSPWRIDEELILPAPIREQRFRYRQRLGLVRRFVAGHPERAARIQGIQHHVAARFAVELRQVFERRIVHNGRLPALPYLREHLPDGRALARPGVAHDEKVPGLALSGNPNPSLSAEEPVNPLLRATSPPD